MTSLEFTLEELPIAAKFAVKALESDKIVLFYGEMGAGKTTLVNEICKFLGVKNPTSSPTYSIVNEYQSSVGIIYHLDLYRLKNLNEALDAGIEEILFSNNLCFVEWPQIIVPLLANHYVAIHITNIGLKRKIEIIHHGRAI